MKILIIGLNYAPEQVGIGPFTCGMAEGLAQAGHCVTVIAGQPYYPAWKIRKDFKTWRYIKRLENGVSVIRCPLYVPRIPSGIHRLIHHASFAISAFPVAIIKSLKTHPDVVLVIAPSLLSAPIGKIVSWLTGAPFWLHLQDFEVDAAFATGLLPPKGPIATLARFLEHSVLGRASVVSTISPQMCYKLLEKGVAAERVVEFRNWANISRVTPQTEVSPFCNEWNTRGRFVALYSGNIANKQGIDIIVDAARKMQSHNDLLFIVCGNGSYRDTLVAHARELNNIQFRDLQPVNELNNLLGLAGVHLLPQLETAADLVLPSKLANMLASGRPIVCTAAVGTALADEAKHGGIVVPPGDLEAFCSAIVFLKDNPSVRIELGRAGRGRAEKCWSERPILDRFEAELSTIANARTPKATSGGNGRWLKRLIRRIWR